MTLKTFLPLLAGILCCSSAFGQPDEKVAQTISTPFGRIELVRSIKETTALNSGGKEVQRAEYGPADMVVWNDQTIFHEWGSFLSCKKVFNFADRSVVLLTANGAGTMPNIYCYCIMLRRNKKPLVLTNREFRSDDGTLDIQRKGDAIEVDLGYFHSRGKLGYHKIARLQGEKLQIVKKPYDMRPPAGYMKKVSFNYQTNECENLPVLSMMDKHWDYYLDGSRPDEKLVLNINVKDPASKLPETYEGKVIVKAPDKTASFSSFKINTDGVYVTICYPDNFSGKSRIMAGVYTVIWEVEDGVVGCNGFEIQENDARISGRK